MSQPIDYKPGDMDVASHRDMYRLFNFLLNWGGLTLATLLSFLVLLLCAHAGFLPSAIVAVVVFAAGFVWLRRPKAH
jgi:MFS superfamily sulfate permease-like transporter